MWDSSLVGRLDKTEEFVDLVDSLDQEWRELELEGMQIIGHGKTKDSPWMFGGLEWPKSLAVLPLG